MASTSTTRPSNDERVDSDGGAGRVAALEDLAADFGEGSVLGHVGHERGYLDDIAEVRARLPKQVVDAVEYMPGLRLHVPGSDDLAVLVHGDHARYEDEPAVGYRDAG